MKRKNNCYISGLEPISKKIKLSNVRKKFKLNQENFLEVCHNFKKIKLNYTQEEELRNSFENFNTGNNEDNGVNDNNINPYFLDFY